MTAIVPTPAAPTVHPYPQLGSPNFSAEAYTYATGMPAVTAGIHAIGVAAETNATVASEQADAALGYRNQAGNEKTFAQAARTGAEAARDAALLALAGAIAAPGTSANSTTSLLIGTGSKTLTIEAGKALSVGGWIIAASKAAPTSQMSGPITAHDPATGVLTFDSRASGLGGGGTFADWTVSITASSAGAAQSATLGSNTFTGAQNDAKGADIASAATVNLTTATGNLVHITGTTAITAITLASGAERTVVFDGVLTLTHGASLQLPGLANITTAAGDRAIFRGDGSSVVCVSYVRASGASLIDAVPTLGATSTPTVLRTSGINFIGCRLADTLSVVAYAGLDELDIVSISGTTITKSTVTGLFGHNPNSLFSFLPVSATQSILICSTTGAQTRAFLVTVTSATTATANSVVVWNNTGPFGSAVNVDSTTTLVALQDGSSTINFYLINRSGGVLTVVSTLPSAGGDGATQGGLVLVRQSATVCVLAYVAGGLSRKRYITGITSTSLVVGSIDNLEPQVLGAIWMDSSPNGDIVVGGYRSTAPNSALVHSIVNDGTSSPKLTPSTDEGSASIRAIVFFGSDCVLLMGFLNTLGAKVMSKRGDGFISVSSKALLKTGSANVKAFRQSSTKLMVIYQDSNNSSYVTAALVDAGTVK